MRNSGSPERTFGWVLGFAGLALTLTAATLAHAEQDTPLKEGTRALYRGDYGTAAARAEQYLKAHPGAVAARILLARAEVAQGKYTAAYEELLKALRADPRNTDALYYLVRVCSVLSQIEYHRLFEMAPDSVRVHQLLAESYAVQGKNSMAEEEYQAALKADPQSVEVLDALGDLKRSQFKFDAAISNYSRAAEIRPQDYDSAYGLGACYLYQRDPQRAIEHFRRALEIDPNSPAARLALGDALLRANQPAAALLELKAAIALAPKMRQVYTLLARAYRRLGQLPQAEEALKTERRLTQEEIEAREVTSRSGDLTPDSSPPPLPAEESPKPED